MRLTFEEFSPTHDFFDYRSLLEPSTGAYPKRLFPHLLSTHLFLRFCIPLLRMS
jgi:hypothetical protein